MHRSLAAWVGLQIDQFARFNLFAGHSHNSRRGWQHASWRRCGARLLVFVAAAGVVATACSNSAATLGGESPTAASFYAARFERQPTVAELTELGRTLFAD